MPKPPIYECFIFQNQILRPLSDNKYTPITNTKWSQNLISTTKTVRNWCLDVYRPKNAKNTHLQMFYRSKSNSETTF